MFFEKLVIVGMITILAFCWIILARYVDTHSNDRSLLGSNQSETNIEFVVLGGQAVFKTTINGNTMMDLNRYILSNKFYDECLVHMMMGDYFYSLSILYGKMVENGDLSNAPYKLPSNTILINNIQKNEQENMDDIEITNTFVTIVLNDSSDKWFIGGSWDIELDFGFGHRLTLSTNHDINMQDVLNSRVKQQILSKDWKLHGYFRIQISARLDMSNIPAFKITHNINVPAFTKDFTDVAFYATNRFSFPLVLNPDIHAGPGEWRTTFYFPGSPVGMDTVFGFSIHVLMATNIQIEEMLDWVSKIDINVVEFGRTNNFVMWDTFIHEYIP